MSDSLSDRMEAPNPSRRRRCIRAERVKSRRAGKLETELDRPLVGLPRPERAELESLVGHHVFREFRFFDGRFAPRRRIEHSHRRAVAEREGEQGSRKNIFAHDESPRRIVQRTAGGAVAIVCRVAVQCAWSQTIHINPVHGRIDRKYNR